MAHFCRRDQSGFTLAEIVVAAAIILIGLVAVLQWFPLGTQGMDTGKRQSTAVFLAEQKIEQIKAWSLSTATVPVQQGFATVVAGGTCFTAGPCANEAVNTIPGYPEYSRTVTVQCVNTQPPPPGSPPAVDPGCAATDTGRLVRVQVGYSRVTTGGVFANTPGAFQVDFATMIVCRTC